LSTGAPLGHRIVAQHASVRITAPVVLSMGRGAVEPCTKRLRQIRDTVKWDCHTTLRDAHGDFLTDAALRTAITDAYGNVEFVQERYVQADVVLTHADPGRDDAAHRQCTFPELMSVSATFPRDQPLPPREAWEVVRAFSRGAESTIWADVIPMVAGVPGGRIDIQLARFRDMSQPISDEQLAFVRRAVTLHADAEAEDDADAADADADADADAAAPARGFATALAPGAADEHGHIAIVHSSASALRTSVRIPKLEATLSWMEGTSFRLTSTRAPVMQLVGAAQQADIKITLAVDVVEGESFDATFARSWRAYRSFSAVVRA
jgi:hypothetical protein